MTDPEVDYLDKFENLELNAKSFGHVDHIRAAYAMLDRYDFLEACYRYANTIKAMAEKVGASDKFNATITISFMSKIAERRTETNWSGWKSFLENNGDLLDRKLLRSLYSEARLNSDVARKQFLLPDFPQSNGSQPIEPVTATS